MTVIFSFVTNYEESTSHINIHYKLKGELDPYYTVSLLSEVSHCQHLQNCSLDQEFGRNAKLMEILLSWRGWDWRWETESWANRRVMESQWETNQRNQSSALQRLNDPGFNRRSPPVPTASPTTPPWPDIMAWILGWLGIFSPDNDWANSQTMPG